MDKIRQIRKARNMTQEDLGNAVGVKRAVISKYETGAISPSFEMVKQIAAALGVTVAEIVDAAPLPNKPMPLSCETNDSVIVGSPLQEHIAFDEYVSSMGYRSFVDPSLTGDSSSEKWVMFDSRENKFYRFSADDLDRIQTAVNQFALFNVSSVLNKKQPMTLTDEKYRLYRSQLEKWE